MKIVSNGKTLEVGGGSSQDIYSLEEQVVGRWIDGKPLYQKVVILSNIPVLEQTEIYALVTKSDYDIDNVVYVSGYIHDNWSTPKYTFYFPGQPAMIVDHDGKMHLRQYITSPGVGKFFNGILVMKYTKTTDQATIELPAALTASLSQTIFTAAPQSAASAELTAEETKT